MGGQTPKECQAEEKGRNPFVLVIRYGEVALKGNNKPYFERALLSRLRARTRQSALTGVTLTRHEGLIYARFADKEEEEPLIKAVSKVFGVDSVSPAVETEPDLPAIYEGAVRLMEEEIKKKGIKTFKVEAKRKDKTFPLKSPELSSSIGGAVLKGCRLLRVDVHHPDVILRADLRHDGCFLYTDKFSASGGLPYGTNGRGLVLLSGGIDSPVAAWMMAKRGMELEAVHFHSYPYTSVRAQKKVEELLGIVASYCGPIRLHTINLLPIQEEIVSHLPEKDTTIHVRRFMMRISEEIARKYGCLMLITGESLGQVASQTAEALAVTDASVSLPVMRPLIGEDKVEIMERARAIGTYEKSIEPYEDCCTVFLPKHPSTKPSLQRVERDEEQIDVKGLIEKAVLSEEVKTIGEEDLL